MFVFDAFPQVGTPSGVVRTIRDSQAAVLRLSLGLGELRSVLASVLMCFS